jgi:hypothetical protein
MCWHLRVGLYRVTIEPDGSANGKTVRRHLLEGVDLEKANTSSSVRSKIENEIMISLAGAIAQGTHDSRSFRRYHDDDDRAYSEGLAMRVTGSAKETEAYLEWLRIRTENMIRNPLHWRAVQTLADELIRRETLSGPQTKEVLLRALLHSDARSFYHALDDPPRRQHTHNRPKKFPR